MNTVLYINLGFYSYDDQIKSELQKKGYNVISYCPETSVKKAEYLLDKINPNYIHNKCTDNLRRFICNIINKSIYIDNVLVIDGKYTTPELLNFMRNSFPHARFTLYLWDDVDRLPTLKSQLHYYSDVYSFDNRDCKKYGFKYVPLFYSREFDYHNESKDTYVYCLGTDHSDRVKIADKFKMYFLIENITYDFHIVRSKPSYYKNRIADIIHKRDYISYKPVSESDYANKLKRSFAILDIPHVSQEGLSMRVIEALASHCKVITSNKEVRKYNFYNADNFWIYDRSGEIAIDESFWNTPFNENMDSVIKEYFIENWIINIGY